MVKKFSKLIEEMNTDKQVKKYLADKVDVDIHYNNDAGK